LILNADHPVPDRDNEKLLRRYRRMRRHICHLKHYVKTKELVRQELIQPTSRTYRHLSIYRETRAELELIEKHSLIQTYTTILEKLQKKLEMDGFQVSLEPDESDEACGNPGDHISYFRKFLYRKSFIFELCAVLVITTVTTMATIRRNDHIR